MTAEALLEEWSQKQGWDVNSQLFLCLQYIERQQDNQCFEDFLSNKAFTEEEMARCFAEAEVRNQENEEYREALEAEQNPAEPA
jgi:hypothetical protein